VKIVRREASRYFKNEKREYLKGKINELATNSKNMNIRGINKCNKGYQPTSNLVKDENGVLLADLHNILNSRKKYFYHLLNVPKFSDFRQIEIRIAESLVPGPSCFEVEITIAKLKNYKLPCSDQIPAELIQAGGVMLLFAIQKHIDSIWSKEELPDQ
jgi:hypothetical protein